MLATVYGCAHKSVIRTQQRRTFAINVDPPAWIVHLTQHNDGWSRSIYLESNPVQPLAVVHYFVRAGYVVLSVAGFEAAWKNHAMLRIKARLFQPREL